METRGEKLGSYIYLDILPRKISVKGIFGWIDFGLSPKNFSFHGLAIRNTQIETLRLAHALPDKSEYDFSTCTYRLVVHWFDNLYFLKFCFNKS